MLSLTTRLLTTIGALWLIISVLAACSSGKQTLEVGFSPFYDSVSHNASSDPNDTGFNTHLGYEADLLTALEAMDDGGLSFNRSAIPEWPGIWLKSATDEFDIVGGGITIRDGRTRNAAGETVVAFTNGHIAFRQSLLVRSADAGRLSTYDDLTEDVVVGVGANTTNETRLLILTGLTDDSGVLIAGVRVETDTGEVIADGSAHYTITAAESSPNLAGRRHLYPPNSNMPQIVYPPDDSGDDFLGRMLSDGDIDAIAREEIPNASAAHEFDGILTVTALDSLVEYGGFTVAADNTELLTLLNERIDFLTDHRRIGYAEWRADPTVFMQRARQWHN